MAPAEIDRLLGEIITKLQHFEERLKELQQELESIRARLNGLHEFRVRTEAETEAQREMRERFSGWVRWALPSGWLALLIAALAWFYNLLRETTGRN